ncbi:hypothetical protein ABNG03_00790 [Halorubrum sp. RMP-47]|uniref:Uncharacterized protein n=1 Tax=Halorubrum miltondacostae TaxID=3076378 RepID=A0ABD5LYQ3_9EURY
MGSIDADTVMIGAGVVLSLLAFIEVYTTWRRTQEHEDIEGGDD